MLCIGCGWCIIGDGGLKAHRSLCAAVSSGVKEFPNSGVSLMTGLLYMHAFFFYAANCPGCPRYPGSNLFCSSHKDHVSPVVHHKQMKPDNLAQLNKDKRGQQHDTDVDGVFLIEEILEKKGTKYHIKWKGYSTTTWEPASSVPQFIQDFYKRTGKSRLPKPRILDSRVCGMGICIVARHYSSIFLGTITEHLLVWDGDTALPEWTAGVEVETDGVEDSVEEGSAGCNTRKDRY